MDPQWEQNGVEKTLKEARTALLEFLKKRFGLIPKPIRQRIAGMGSVQEIIAVSARVATAPSLDALGLT